jgi:hypothetical protein
MTMLPIGELLGNEMARGSMAAMVGLSPPDCNLGP